MKDKVANTTRWVLYVLLILSALLGVFFYAHGISTDAFLNGGKIMLVLGVIVLIVAPTYTLIMNPKNLMKMLVSIVILAVILAVSYGFATNHMSALQLETYNISAMTSRLVGMGLIATYISFVLSILVILYSGFMKIFK